MSGRQSQDGVGLSGLAGLLVIPLMLLCCGGPLIAAAVASLGFGAWLAAHGLLVAGVLVLVAAAVLAVWWLLAHRPRAPGACCPPVTVPTTAELHDRVASRIAAPPSPTKEDELSSSARQR
jgi:hypothetical protein